MTYIDNVSIIFNNHKRLQVSKLRKYLIFVESLAFLHRLQFSCKPVSHNMDTKVSGTGFNNTPPKSKTSMSKPKQTSVQLQLRPSVARL